ncbi:UNVERIFIED_CONTAM: hypothetical protein Sradi_7077100 [Sesamum radiatum]|uniref:Transposase n=1 Tax=Sesamum radiatum TaxID=300843 RepID=A0AAW2J5E5_SESRA
MDKSCIGAVDRLSDEYAVGVAKFLEFAFLGKARGSRICCPCSKCRNQFSKTHEDVMLHCLRDGFDHTHTSWTCHGEMYIPLHISEDHEFPTNAHGDDMPSMLRDAMGIPNKDDHVENDQHLNGADVEIKRFFKLLRDAETDLFPGCKKQTKLSFISGLLHLKVLCRWCNHLVNLLLELLRDTFPDNVNLHANYYETNKIIAELGFSCEVIDACPNNCILFRGKDGKLDECEICGEGRYKDEAKKVATKRMRYFPLKPRLQKLFMSTKTASLMRWHAKERIEDGVLRHPADSQAWKPLVDELKELWHIGVPTYDASCGHRLRRDRVSFDGTMELSPKPMPLSEVELLQQLEIVPTEYKKEDLRKRLRSKGADRKGKTKHNLNARKDLQVMNIWSSLHPISRPDGGILCSKVNPKLDLEKIQDRIALTLCHLEKNFPPSFFDIMEHLPVHLAEEALLAGPVQFRWMYPIERYLSTLKRYVRNRARSEGTIARGYLMEECMNFCSRYLNDVETKENRPPRNYDGDNNMGRGLYGGTRCIIDKDTLLKIHRYVLSNIDLVAPYREMHYATIRREKLRATPREIQHIHSQTFDVWFKSYNTARANALDVPKELIALADGPIRHAKRYNACVVGGCRYRVKSKDIDKKTQCSGVVVNADTLSFASAKDLNPRSRTVSYYGVLKDILENLPTDEPFVLASQAQQVWYISDPSEANWNVVVTMTRRDNYCLYSTIEVEPHSRVQLDDNIPSRNEDVCWVREGVEGSVVDETMMTVENTEVGNDIEPEDDFDVSCMSKENKIMHGKTMLEIMENKKKKESSKERERHNSNDFIDYSVSTTRQQPPTMGEIIKMKKREWQRDYVLVEHQVQESPSRPETRSQQHLSSSSQVFPSPSRPQTRSQQHLSSLSQVQHSPSWSKSHSQQQFNSSPSRPQTRSQQQLYPSPSRPHTRSQQCTQSSPTKQHEISSEQNTTTGPVSDDCVETRPTIVKKGRGAAQFP